jgi:predicted ATPase/DNA-binding winged helix-turn-helix (wHTH) protein
VNRLASTVNPVRYRFGSFELQPMERRLLEAGAPVAVGPRAFRVLVVLVERAGHLVTKDELLAAVWPRVIVEENALQAQISALRKVLGAKAIATVSRSGYRFELAVERVATASAAPEHNLPQPVTAFIGREREMREVERLLETTRVLTLTAAGGCGKTRLALQVSTALMHAYPDGVRFVEPATVADPRLVPQAVARALEVRERPGRTLTQALCDSVASARTLVLLDNAEHLLEACAALVGDFIRSCPNVRVLVTSRERLDIAGEVTYRVPSLSVPSSKKKLAPDELLTIDSVRLFVDRAQATRPHFRVTEENAASLVSVCRRLDGIPLAIELAAPRLRAMSLEEIDRRLDQCLSLLTSASRTAVPRHRTLRALLDWSYDLMSANEQALLQRLSCFAGGWTLEAAEQVCACEGIEAREILDLLMSLADKSLVMADEIGGATRYKLLETVRQYAGERARERDAALRWQARHFDFYFDIAERARDSAATVEHAKWLGILDAEHDNLRAALAWSATPGADVSRGLRLGAALWRFWWLRGYSGEGSKVLLALLAIAPESLDPAIRLEALSRAALLLTYAAEFPTARTLFESALAIARAMGDQRPLAQVLVLLGVFHLRQGEPAAARKYDEEAIELWRALGDRRALGNALGNLATIVCQMGDPKAALRLHEESLAIRREFADRWAIATELHNLSTTLRELGDLAAARKASEEALTIYREFGEVPGTASALGRLGLLACDEGDYVSALLYLKEGTRLFADVGDRIGIASMLAAIGYASMSEEPNRAARLWGAAERLREEIGASRSTVDTARYRGLEAAARTTAADDEAFDAAWHSGRALGFQAAVEYALATVLGPDSTA